MIQRPEFHRQSPSLPFINRLFLALFPDAGAVKDISSLATTLRQQHGLTGGMRPPDQWHVTLHWFGDYYDVPERVVQAAGKASDAVAARMPAFDVKLDSVTSFRGLPGNHPLVLMRNGEGNATLMKFHQVLTAELTKRQCFNKSNARFNPHLTLFYDRQMLRKTTVEPVRWTAGNIVLVRSEVGAAKYHRLEDWTLAG